MSAPVDGVGDPTPTVSALLSQARQHEQKRRELANKRIGKQHTPQYAKATIEAQAALEKRRQAHDLDPDHLDPVWALDPVSNAELCAFLHAWIGKP